MFKVRQKPWQGDLAVTGNVMKRGGRREGIKQAWIAIPVANLFGPVSVHRSALQLLGPLAASHKVKNISRISRCPIPTLKRLNRTLFIRTKHKV